MECGGLKGADVQTGCCGRGGGNSESRMKKWESACVHGAGGFCQRSADRAKALATVLCYQRVYCGCPTTHPYVRACGFADDKATSMLLLRLKAAVSMHRDRCFNSIRLETLADRTAMLYAGASLPATKTPQHRHSLIHGSPDSSTNNAIDTARHSNATNGVTIRAINLVNQLPTNKQKDCTHR